MGPRHLVATRDARRMAVLALLLYAAFIAYQSLADGGTWQCGGPVLSTHGRLSRSDLLANTVAYIPLGLLCVLVAIDRAADGWRRLPRGVAAGVLVPSALSLGLELLQSCQSNRMSGAYDWLANSFGALVGVTLALLLRSSAIVVPARAGHVPARPYASLRLFTALVAIAWIVSQTMPWVFSVDIGTMRSNLSFLRRWSHAPPLDAWHVVRHAGAWMALACACRLVARDARLAVAALIGTGGLSLSLQVLLEARTPLSFEELTGMACGAGLALPAMLLARHDAHAGRWAVGLFCGALLVVGAYELRPEPSAIAATREFSWWPNVGLGSPLGALDYALLFGWFGLATVVAARWADVAGYRHARRGWPALAVLAMLAFEIAQTAIPGRGPDVSAPVFTLLAVLAAHACVQYVERAHTRVL